MYLFTSLILQEWQTLLTSYVKYKVVECRCLSSLFIILVQISCSWESTDVVWRNTRRLFRQVSLTNKLKRVQKEYRKKNKRSILIGENKNEAEIESAFNAFIHRKRWWKDSEYQSRQEQVPIFSAD